MWTGFSLAIQLIFGDWSTRAAIIASLINFFLFFGGDFIRFLKNEKKYGAQRLQFSPGNEKQSKSVLVNNKKGLGCAGPLFIVVFCYECGFAFGVRAVCIRRNYANTVRMAPQQE